MSGSALRSSRAERHISYLPGRLWSKSSCTGNGTLLPSSPFKAADGKSFDYADITANYSSMCGSGIDRSTSYSCVN
jgi:hypothetical protein